MKFCMAAGAMMPQEGTQYRAERESRVGQAAHAESIPLHYHHDHFYGMRPWLQRTIIGVCVAVTVTGLTVMSGVVMENQKSAARIEAKLDDVSADFDSFVNLRYQRDVDELEADVAMLKIKTSTQP